MITRLEMCHFRADRNNCAGRLVAESERLANDDVAVSEVVVIVKIGTAETGGLDGDLDFVVGGLGKLTLFLFNALVYIV